MFTLTKATMRRSGASALCAAAVALINCGNGVAHADPPPTPPYPVPYHFIIDSVQGALQGANASPPGTNNWSCKPSSAHPEPVILVHGFLADQADNWQTFGPLLANHGYCVFALTYGGPAGIPIGGLGSMESSAQTLGAFVEQVRSATGAAKVDLVGHSEGATMPYWYLKFDHGSAAVAKMVGLAPVVHGIGGPALFDSGLNTGFSNGPAATEFSSGSPFIRQLDTGGITVPGVAYTQIVTRYDDVVIPYDSGIIPEPHATNITMQDQCSQDFADHLSLASDPNAARDVLNALDPAHAQPVQCVPVLPVVGTVSATGPS